MGVAGHLLILLIPVLSLCGATEYYVRPTEPTNTSCPAQPCLTLSQYVNESDYFFKSNTVFKFLPGTHHMDMPVTIGNVHNVLLENIYDGHPHLVAQFSCETGRHINCLSTDRRIPYVCCAAISLHDMSNVTLKGLSVTIQSSKSSAVILRNVSNGYIKLTATCSLTSRTCLGILLYEAKSIDLHSSTTNKCSYGLVLYHTTNINITNMYAAYNEDGIVVFRSTDTHITNTTAAHNRGYGMYLSNMNSTHISNATTIQNGKHGMYLCSMTNTYIADTITTSNNHIGMYLLTSSSTHITNTMATHNHGDGLYLESMKNTHIINTTALHNRECGILGRAMINTYITNITATHNTADGLSLGRANNTHVIDTAAKHNNVSGLFLLNAINTHIINISANINDCRGMHLLWTNNTIITNAIAAHNGRLGVYLERVNSTHITNLTALHNYDGGRGSDMLVNGQSEISSHLSTYTHLSNSSFTDISTSSSASAAIPNNLPAVVELYHSTLYFSECQFIRNNVSAVRAYASNITLSGDLIFSDNRATAGTAFVLLRNSIISLAESNHVYFSNNHATNTGGVFYIVSDVYLGGLTEDENICFVNTARRRSQTRFTFVNNSAGRGGDILYGGYVGYSLDKDMNCLESFKTISNISQSGLSLISSDQSRTCLCNEHGHPDCLVLADPTTHIMYPGQTLSISAVAVGQDFGTVAGSVYAQFLSRSFPRSTSQLESWQKVQTVTQNSCNHLDYTIFSQNEGSEAVLVLTAQDSYVADIFTNKETESSIHEWEVTYRTYAPKPLMYLNNPVYVNISILPCPPGFILTTHPPFRCDCNLQLRQMHGIKCHIQNQTISRSGLVWVGMIQDDNGTSGSIAASEYCPLDYCSKGENNVTLSEPDSQCNYNHSGTLCGGCQPGLSLALGSAQCLPCSNKYLALLLPFALAGPMLVFLIKVLDLTISQGTMNGLIFYANVVKANEYILLPQGQTNPLTVFIAWLNLDLGIETCFFQGLSSYSKTWLQFAFPFYIWSIVGLIIILAKYSDRVARIMGNNSVPVLATLFLLSYAKLFRTIITALSYTMLYSSQGHKAVWSADGNVDYLGPKHAPLFAAAVAALLILWLPYTLILFLGQWLHRCNSRCISHMMMKIKPFLDAHYGPLKGKHRYWFGALLLVRAIILLISALVPANRTHLILLCILVCAVALTYFGQFVHHNLIVSKYDTASFMNLALLAGITSTAVGEPAVAAYVLIGIAFAQFVGLVLFKIFSILKSVMKCCQKEEEGEDDWELYEQAALEREMERDIEEEGSDSSGSIESLPTY